MLETWLSQWNCPISSEKRSLLSLNKEKDIKREQMIPSGVFLKDSLKFKNKKKKTMSPGKVTYLGKRRLSITVIKFLKRQVIKSLS